MLNTSALEANIQGLEPATSYTFRVVAVNRAGEGPAETIEVTTHEEGERERNHGRQNAYIEGLVEGRGLAKQEVLKLSDGRARGLK